jgi:hypothetical protein
MLFEFMSVFLKFLVKRKKNCKELIDVTLIIIPLSQSKDFRLGFINLLNLLLVLLKNPFDISELNSFKLIDDLLFCSHYKIMFQLINQVIKESNYFKYDKIDFEKALN